MIKLNWIFYYKLHISIEECLNLTYLVRFKPKNTRYMKKAEILLTVWTRHDKSQLRRDHDAGDGLFVACQRSSRCRHFTFAHDGLGPGVPVPQQDGAICRAGGDIAIRSDVTLGSRQTCHDTVMTENDLDYFGGFRREHPEAVVPESASDQEFAVDCRYEAVWAYFHVLAEIIP